MLAYLVCLRLAWGSDSHRTRGTACFQKIIPTHPPIQGQARMFAKNIFAAVQANNERRYPIQKQRSGLSGFQQVDSLGGRKARYTTIKAYRPFQLAQRQSYWSAKQRDLTRVPMRGRQAKVMNFE